MNGDQIRAARLARGWTIHTAAEKAGVTPKTFIRAESGEPIRELTQAAIFRSLSTADELPAGPNEISFEDLARLVPKLPLSELNRLMDMVRTAIAIREGGVS